MPRFIEQFYYGNIKPQEYSIKINKIPDWGDGWENVSFSVSCENRRRLDERMPRLLDLPAKHR